MSWLAWLFDTQPFRAPNHAMGWTDELTRMTIATNAVICTLALLVALALLVLLRMHPVFRRNASLVVWHLLVLITFGGAHLIRALSFWWPCYRLQVCANGLVAFALWAQVAAFFPYLLTVRRSDQEREVDLLWGNLEAIQARLRVREAEILRVLAKMDQLTPLLPKGVAEELDAEGS